MRILPSLVFLIIGSSCGVFTTHGASLDGELSTKPSPHDKDLVPLLQGYSLLQDLTNEEVKVDDILIIRDLSPQVGTLLKGISAEAQSLKEDLDLFRKSDPTFRPSSSGLPELEQATRAGIKKMISGRIIYGKEPDVEVDILLSQIQGLDYGENLLQTIAQRDLSTERRDTLLQHASKWKILRQWAFSLLVKK